ncbi:MAG: hypothetical protein GY719_01045 [bacterium]|nr:hypothetical protein [bacterium]
MKLKFFTIPALDSQEAEEELNRFLGSHRVLAADRHLVQEGGAAYWAVCVTYVEGEGKAAPVKRGKITVPALKGRFRPTDHHTPQWLTTANATTYVLGRMVSSGYLLASASP